MFKFLSVKPTIDTHHNLVDKGLMSPRQAPTLLAAAMTGVLLLSGCQQQAETPPVPDDSQTTEKTAEEDSQPMQKSDSAAARIEQYQPIYVAQAQGLQRRLQAEYESLQAADASVPQESLLLNGTTDDFSDNNDSYNNDDIAGNNENNDSINIEKNAGMASGATSSTVAPTSPMANVDSDTNSASDIANDAANEIAAEDDINTSTEVGERDLTVLKRISLEPRKPTILTEAQIIERYQQVMEALYQPVTTPLSAEDTDTLINVATLVPQLFEDAEIAGRVNAKSPALARLVIQHQVWEQIEAQQVLDMQQMKRTQQQEFEMLMTKFNETIEGYDEQIAKYEQTLKAFE